MNGMTFNEFYDALYYGADIDFEYNNVYYHINAGADNEKYGITVIKYSAAPWEQNVNLSGQIVYEKALNTQTESVEDFLSSSIFDGKCLNDIIDLIIVHFS